MVFEGARNDNVVSMSDLFISGLVYTAWMPAMNWRSQAASHYSSLALVSRQHGGLPTPNSPPMGERDSYTLPLE